MVICLKYGHFENKLRSVIVSQNHYIIKICYVHPLNEQPLTTGKPPLPNRKTDLVIMFINLTFGYFNLCQRRNSLTIFIVYN